MKVECPGIIKIYELYNELFASKWDEVESSKSFFVWLGNSFPFTSPTHFTEQDESHNPLLGNVNKRD